MVNGKNRRIVHCVHIMAPFYQSSFALRNNVNFAVDNIQLSLSLCLSWIDCYNNFELSTKFNQSMFSRTIIYYLRHCQCLWSIKKTHNIVTFKTKMNQTKNFDMINVHRSIHLTDKTTNSYEHQLPIYWDFEFK